MPLYIENGSKLETLFDQLCWELKKHEYKLVTVEIQSTKPPLMSIYNHATSSIQINETPYCDK